MTLIELLADVVRRLDAAHIEYMITGSVASAFHGEPRATRDLDVVIDPRPEALAALVDGFLAILALWLWSLAGHIGRPAEPG